MTDLKNIEVNDIEKLTGVVVFDSPYIMHDVDKLDTLMKKLLLLLKDNNINIIKDGKKHIRE